MRLVALVSVLVLAGCGLDMMGRRSPELAVPTVSALMRETDGTETVRLRWKDSAVTREYLEKTSATSSGAWLIGTRVPSDKELELRFGQGFAQSMAGQGVYSVTLTMPDGSQMASCPCCRHSSHMVRVDFAFDGAGTVTSAAVTQVVK